MAVGLKDIARMTGVSVETVSNVLNRGREHLCSPETRDKIVRCSQRVGYVPHRSAQAMRSRSTRVIGFVVFNVEDDGRLTNYPVYPFLVGMNRRLSLDQYHVAMVEVGEVEMQRPREIPAALRERFFDGLVLYSGVPERAGQFAAALGIPVIWWDSGFHRSLGHIYRDEEAVGQTVTRRLIDRGHRRIAYMVGQRGWEKYTAGQPVHYSYSKRLESFQAEMRNHGLTPEFLVGYEAKSLASQLQEKRITAVVVNGSAQMSPLAEARQALGWSVPRDLSIAACDIEPRMPVVGPVLGGLSYDRVAAGTKGAEMMLAMLAHPKKPVPSVRLLGDWSDGDTVAGVGG